MALRGNTLNAEACHRFGVSPRFVKAFFGGIHLTPKDLSSPKPEFWLEDYPAFAQADDQNLQEINRLISIHKLITYPLGMDVPGLSKAPSNVVQNKVGRRRVVTDWSHEWCALNKFLRNPGVRYASIASFVRLIVPNGYLSGHDLRDCFHLWILAPIWRRLCGVAHPELPHNLSYAFLPMGLGPSPGISDSCLKEILRVIIAHHPEMGLKIADFVDDLRIAHGTNLQEAEAAHKAVFDSCSELGIILHNDPRTDPSAKADKNVPPTRKIDFLGFTVSSELMRIFLQPDKVARALEMIEFLLTIIDDPSQDSDGKCTAKYVAGALGLLNFFCIVIRRTCKRIVTIRVQDIN